ncbi:acetylornithine deacetylase [Oleispirillum naphthae]|uniref:acetylornithine deacetylase n=1 Tax=Oleispirillum naphthae TaxID=2838853 RepID=UPI00308231A5
MSSESLDTLNLLKTLVAFPTVSRDSNLALIDWIEAYVTRFGATCRRTYNAEKTKGNLFVTIGPADVPGVILSGHTDVVPVDGQDWATDPFAVAEKEGRLYGRGTADMKSFLAVILAYVPRFAAAKLKKPVHLAFSHDEEVGCIGVCSLIEDMAHLPVIPEMCIVGEPTLMRPMLAHKGKVNVRVRVKGWECHSSLAPTGVNAIEYAAELIAFLKALARRKSQEGPFDTMFDIAHTTVHTGLIEGGTALNIVPQDCTFDFEIRAVPADDRMGMLEEIKAYVAAELEPPMKAVHPACGFSWEVLSSVPGSDTDPNDPIVHMVSHLSGANSYGKVAFGTEAGRFQTRWNMPTVICGPGDIDQAHKPDEYIELSQIRACEGFIARLLERMAA